MRGLTDLTEQIFELPARTAVPTGFDGIVDAIAQPQFSTVAGITRFGYENMRHNAEDKFPKPGLLGRIKSKFRNLF